MFDWATTTGALALGSVVVIYIARRTIRTRPPYPLPPGPPGLPWIGNVIGVNASTPWTTYAEWARTYGDIVYSRLLGKDIIILNSEKIAKDLLENRSKFYSDRPYFITAELCGLDFETPVLPCGDRWRLHRRFFHQTFRPNAVQRFLPSQHRRACHLLRQLLDSPEKLGDHVFEYTAAVIMNCTYDYDPASRKDELVDIVENVLRMTVPIMRPEINLVVGTFPWLLYLPSWFPGMSFKKDMALAREFSKVYLDRPFEYAVQKAPRGGDAPSMVHDALREMEEKGISPEQSWMDTLKEVSGSAFLAGADTSNATLMAFFLMMVVNQGAQEKAQAEIDAVVGKGRLPTMDDRPLLPYLDAIFRETVRYGPVAPLGECFLPRATMDDNTYGGFLIPKGAVVITNLWAIAHDESRYPNPHAFIPERFLNDDGSLKPDDIEHIVFGFGRRICAGRHFADASMWSVIAKVLAVFKILRALDENGVEIPVEPRFAPGISLHPLPFGYRIVPRFPGMDAEKLEQLIAASTP
ncbi:cytochrome P450 [Boletus coccyginus]|nr:cytochrome P450 [Boletus coccyginus]